VRRIREQARLRQRGRRRATLQRAASRQPGRDLDQSRHIGVPDALQRHRDSFPDTPARIIGAAQEQTKRIIVAGRDQSPQPPDAAERYERFGRVLRRLRGLDCGVRQQPVARGFVLNGLAQFEVGAGSRQIGVAAQENVPLLDGQRPQPLPVVIDLAH
jgi:hypothetical protein